MSKHKAYRLSKILVVSVSFVSFLFFSSSSFSVRFSLLSFIFHSLKVHSMYIDAFLSHFHQEVACFLSLLFAQFFLLLCFVRLLICFVLFLFALSAS